MAWKNPNYGERTRVYTTKHMKMELLRRMRVVAVKAETTLEDVVNRVIEAGLPIIEAEFKS